VHASVDQFSEERSGSPPRRPPLARVGACVRTETAIVGASTPEIAGLLAAEDRASGPASSACRSDQETTARRSLY
jgi:hypothetical protein